MDRVGEIEKRLIRRNDKDVVVLLASEIPYLLSLVKAADELASQIERMNDWFETLKAEQETKLNKSYEKAVENWDRMESDGFNFTPLFSAYAAYRLARGTGRSEGG